VGTASEQMHQTCPWCKPACACLPTDLAQSFFVGDAAGREGDEVGSSDREFAEAIGLRFLTPEEVFGCVKIN